MVAHVSQKATILEMLQMGPVCGTQFLAKYMPRYAARIHELRTEGHPITSSACKLHDHKSPQVLYKLHGDNQLSLLG